MGFLPGASKEIVKPKPKAQRQSCACDCCRRSKRKCNGQSPCDRCQASGKLCTYSPQKRRTVPKSKAIENQSIIPMDSHLTDTALSRQYLSLYFDRVNPVHIIVNVDTSQYDQIKSKSQLLQYNAILASATRAFGEGKSYRSFENRARQLALELADDFSYDTAFGFNLLAFHLWGEDNERALHYRNITFSLCDSILKRDKRQNNNTAHTLRLKLMTSGISHFESTGLAEALSVKEELENIQDGEEGLTSNRDLYDMISSRFKIHTMLFKDVDAEEFFKDLFKRITPFQQDEMMQTIRTCENSFSKKWTSLYNHKIMIAGLIYFLQAVVCHCGNNTDAALTYIRQLIGLFDSNPDFITTSSTPIFITTCHMLFLIAFKAGDYGLANRISGYQRKIADLLPSCREIMERDMELLKSVTDVINQSKSSPPLQSSSLSPSLSLDQKYPPFGKDSSLFTAPSPFVPFSTCANNNTMNETQLPPMPTTLQSLSTSPPELLSIPQTTLEPENTINQPFDMLETQQDVNSISYGNDSTDWFDVQKLLNSSVSDLPDFFLPSLSASTSELFAETK